MRGISKFASCILFVFSSTLSATEHVASAACRSLDGSFYSDEDREELGEYCAYPLVVRNNLPNIYWLPHPHYQSFLNSLPDQAQAPRNFSAQGGNDDAEVSRWLDERSACHFYSSISNSVISGYVNESDRTKIVTDLSHFLSVCTDMRAKIDAGEMQPCSTLEIAGHSTQAIGLDTVFGIDYNFKRRNVFPSEWEMGVLSMCLKNISTPNTVIVMSTCGAERNDQGEYHYWRHKESAQQEWSNFMGRAVLSGIGPVRGTDDYGENGVESPQGWHLSLPQLR